MELGTMTEEQIQAAIESHQYQGYTMVIHYPVYGSSAWMANKRLVFIYPNRRPSNPSQDGE